MSETNDALTELLSTAALLKATLQHGTEAFHLYSKDVLADMLQLHAERVVLIMDAEECCGDVDGGELCGCCERRLEEAAYKMKQIQGEWEKAA